jgi:histidyl-tRNA synthetase
MAENFGAPRGTQDFVPPESGRWNALEARIHLLAERFGYGEIRTPVFESTDLFVRGSARRPTSWKKKCTPSPTARAGA